eukprot:gene4205-5978_t
MADLADMYKSNSNSFFQQACQDVVRIVSILSLDATTVRKPLLMQTTWEKLTEKSTFLYRFFYMVFIKGFTPTIFDALPYSIWRAISVLVYIYRLVILPFWLRVIGYGKYTNWENLGKLHPTSDEKQIVLEVSLLKESKLADTNFGDPKFEYFASKLFSLTTHLSPHSQSPANPFNFNNHFPGNFFDHLTGVYKILLAWKQPIYVMRAGLFHSVYGTFDYRYSLFDLRNNGREELSSIIGPAAEEIAFGICTADRIGMIMDLVKTMYGDTSGFGTNILSQLINPKSITSNYYNEVTPDGNPHLPLKGKLDENGFILRNHITQKLQTIPPKYFAQFIIVFMADFMDQGAIGMGSYDFDICLFQFFRFRFFADLIQYVKPYLLVVPPVFEKYMGPTVEFKEPIRSEIIALKKIWHNMLKQFYVSKNKFEEDGSEFIFDLKGSDYYIVQAMVVKYPYLAEPKIVLSSTMSGKDAVKLQLSNDKNKMLILTRSQLAKEGQQLIEEWGMLSVKDTDYKIKDALKVVKHLLKSFI